MKLKDQLILRQIGKQYMVVPVGKRIKEGAEMIRISVSAAYLWEFMKKDVFSADFLCEKIMEHYSGVTEEQAKLDIHKFLQTLVDNSMVELDEEEKTQFTVTGKVLVRVSKEDLPKEALPKEE